MTKSSKYRSYGIRRENNISDVDNYELSLNNLINNLPEVVDGKSFISQDLDAIRGLGATNITSETFLQLGGTAQRYTFTEDNTIKEDYVKPIIRLKDRFDGYRSITGPEGQLGSGLGPLAYFIPSENVGLFNANTFFEDAVDVTGVETSEDYWANGEFQINNRTRSNFSDNFGGVMWEGYFYADPNVAIQSFEFLTTGLFHVEYDVFDDGNWKIAKSIYDTQRSVTVAANASNSTSIIIEDEDIKYVAIGDFLNGDSNLSIRSISGSTLVISNPMTVNVGDILTAEFNIGIDTINSRYTIPIVLDSIESPSFKIRIFWWYPTSMITSPQIKYLYNTYSTSRIFPFFRMNIDKPSMTYGNKQISKLVQESVVPTQDIFGEIGLSGNGYREYKTNSFFKSVYTPKSSVAEITNVGSTNISFENGNRYINGSSVDFALTELGNYIIPSNPSDLGVTIEKNLRIKDFLGQSPVSDIRIINDVLSTTQINVPVDILDHNGLIDYFVISTSSDVVTLPVGETTDNLKVDMICITPTSNSTDFIHITEIISSTEFRVSSVLTITNQYIFIYANSGLVDRTKEVFCEGVFGKLLTSNATTNILSLDSVAGIVLGQVVQFDGFIPTGAIVTDIVGLDVEISEFVTQTIEVGATIVFTPFGTSTNKEGCVLPLDLSPPFLGIETGLSTNGKNILSNYPSVFNVKFNNLISEANTVVSSSGSTPTYDRALISINGYKILGSIVV